MTIFGGIIVAQILLWLFGIWMINVKSLVEFQSCPSPDKATHCKVEHTINMLATSRATRYFHFSYSPSHAAIGEGLHIDDMHAYGQVTAADFTGKKEIVPLERKKLEDGQLEISFEFRKQSFHYDPEKDVFEKLAYPVQVRNQPNPE